MHGDSRTGSSQKGGHCYSEMRYLGRRLWGDQSQVIERVTGQEGGTGSAACDSLCHICLQPRMLPIPFSPCLEAGCGGPDRFRSVPAPSFPGSYLLAGTPGTQTIHERRRPSACCASPVQGQEPGGCDSSPPSLLGATSVSLSGHFSRH